MSTIPQIKGKVSFGLAIEARDVEFVIARLEATQAVLRDREQELLNLKGPCSHAVCSLHHAHSGPCKIPGKLA